MRHDPRLFLCALLLSLAFNAIGMAGFCLILCSQVAQHTPAFELLAYGDGGDGLPVGAATFDGAEGRPDNVPPVEPASERAPVAIEVLEIPDVTATPAPTELAELPPLPSAPPRSNGTSTGTGNGGGATGRGGRPGSLTGVRLLDAALPTYPEAARAQGMQGRAIVHISISADGQVVDAVLHHSSGYPLLDEAALRHARTRHFSPARAGNVPVASTALYPITFSLTDRR